MNTNQARKLFSSLAALLMATGGALLPARAQQPPASVAPAVREETAIKLEEFIVSAQKAPRALSDVPASVQPISGDALSAFKLFSATDIVKLAPGLDVNIASPNNPIPSMRGLTFDTFSGVSPTVNLYWNELTIDSGSAFRAMYDMGQVEVLRGPQGTLRAGSAPGGAVLFATHKADLNERNASVQLSASDKHLFNTQVMANVPILKGKLALRLAGLYDGDDANYAHNVITGSDSRSFTRSIRATLSWKPTEDVDVNLVHQYIYQSKNVEYISAGTNIFSSRTDLPAALSPFDRVSIQPSDNKNEFRSRMTSLTVDWKLPGNNQLNFIGGLSQPISNTTTTTNRGNLIPTYKGAQIVTTASSYPTASYELRFGSVNHKFWNYDFGLFYTKPTGNGIVTLDGSQLSTIFTTPSAQPTAPPRIVITQGSTITGTSDGTKALFTTQSFKFTDALKLEVGLRKQTNKSTSVQTLPLFMQLGTLTIPIGSSNSTSVQDTKPTTGSASLSYRINSTVNTYLAWGRSWRPGGVGNNTLGAAYDKYYRYKEEKSDGFELGVKSSLLHRKLQFNADVYYQKFDGYQDYRLVALRTDLTGQTLNTTSQFVVNGKAEAKGVEVGLMYSFPYRIVFNFDAAYSESVWANGTMMPVSAKNAAGQYVFDTPGEYASYRNVGGQRLGNAPKFTASPRVEWTNRVGENEVFARALMKYTSDRQFTANVNRDILGGYALLDLQAGLRDKNGNWDVTIWGKNVLGRKALDYFEDPYATFIWVSGFRQVVPTNPTEVGVTVSRRF